MKNPLLDSDLLPSLIAQAEAGSGWMDTMLIMLIFMGGMYFLLIAPQRKKQKQHEKMLASLQVGEKVLTSGGIYGIISQVKQPDRFIIKIADDTKVEVHRGFIQNRLDNGKTNGSGKTQGADTAQETNKKDK